MKRRKLFAILELQDAESRLAKSVATFITTLVMLNVLAVILSTEERLAERYTAVFWRFEVFSVAVFTVEYVLRLWVCTAASRYRRPVLGRVAYGLSALALVDLVALVPFYLPMLIAVDLRFMRILRLVRIFRLLKATRYSSAFATIARVVQSKREELIITLVTVVSLLVFASSVMYLAEHKAQPEVFSSIPAAMWWGVVTLTTVGYGDIYPITVLGKCCAAVIAILSVGLFALPAGVLASGFAEAVRKDVPTPDTCPHCGKSLSESPPVPVEAGAVGGER